jgi:cell division protein FtsW (lipid II flippase)
VYYGEESKKAKEQGEHTGKGFRKKVQKIVFGPERRS